MAIVWKESEIFENDFVLKDLVDRSTSANAKIRTKRFPISRIFSPSTLIFDFVGLRFDIYGSINNGEDAEELQKIFKNVYKKLSENYNAIRASFAAVENLEVSLIINKIFKLKQETRTLLHDIRLEMQGDFQYQFNDIKSLQLGDEVANLSNFLRYFWSNIDTGNDLSKNMRVAQLEAAAGFLDEITKASKANGSLSVNLNYIINEKLAHLKDFNEERGIQTLNILYCGIQTYVSIYFLVLQEYAFLANFYFEQSKIDKCNEYLDKLRLNAPELASTLLGKKDQTGLLEKVISMISEISAIPHKHSFYDLLLQRKASLVQAQKCVAELAAQLIPDQPQIMTRKPDFSASAIQTPFGDWKDGEKVSYAIQFEKNNAYSRISEWSAPITIVGKASPLLTVPIDTGRKNRVLYRKFGNGKPEFIGIMKDVYQTQFRDINRDLYNAAHSINETESMEIMEILLRNGADINTVFEEGRKLIHAAAEAGNVNLARRFLLANNATDINVKDDNGFTALHLASAIGYAEFVELLLEHNAGIDITNTEEQLPLHIAAFNGHDSVLKVLLKNNANSYVNAPDKQGLTPLHAAIFGGLYVIETLLSNNAVDVNAKSNTGLTPLQLAILHDYHDIAKTLLQNKKLDINAVSVGDFTALHFAAMMGSTDMIRLLCSNESIDINAGSIYGWRALHFAVNLKDRSTVSALLDCHAVNVNEKAEEDIAPLHLAAQNGAQSILSTLIEKGALIEAQTKNNYTALHLAAIEGHLEEVTTLIEHGANIESKTSKKYTPLLLAASSKSSNIDILKYLVEKGAKTDASNDEGEKMIFLAAKSGCLDMMKYLIKSFDKPDNSETSKYGTLLHYAVRGGNLEIVRYLIEELNFKVGTENNNEESPLCIAHIIGDSKLIDYLTTTNETFDAGICKFVLERAAKDGDLELIKTSFERGTVKSFDTSSGEILLPIAVKHNQRNVINYLVNHKVGLNAIDKDGKTCLVYAVENSDVDMVKYLIEHGAEIAVKNDERNLLFHAIEKSIEMVKTLIENGADVNTKDSFDLTTLHMALLCQFPSLEIIKYLVEKGAIVNAKSKSGQTALHYTVDSNIEIVKFLIENGADVNAEDNSHNTPLHFAFYSKSPSLDQIKYLLEKGVHVNIKGYEGKTALHLAVEKSAEIAKFLIEHGADIAIKDDDGNIPLKYSKFEDLREYLEPKTRTRRGLLFFDFKRTQNTQNKIFNSKNKIPQKIDLSPPELTYTTTHSKKTQRISASNTLWTAENLAFLGCIAEALDNSASKRYQRLLNHGVNVIPNNNAAVYDARKRFYEYVEKKIGAWSYETQAEIREELDKVDSDIVASLMRGVEFSGFVGLDHVLRECRKCFENNFLKNAFNREEI